MDSRLGHAGWLGDPLSVFTGRVFDANIFHPSAGTLTFSDHLLQSLVLSPLYAITGNLALCYNVLLIGSLALSGLAMHALARSVTGSHRAAFVIAGLAWACWPYRTAHLLHLQLQSLYFLPLALLAPCGGRTPVARRAAAGPARCAGRSLGTTA